MQGRKDDQGKARWDLVPWEALAVVVQVLTFGAVKYAPDNWRSVPEWRRRYVAALMRHLTAWIGGERFDRETKIHHLGHAGCCVLFLLALDMTDERAPGSPFAFACSRCARDWSPHEVRSQGEGEGLIHFCPDCGHEVEPKG